MSNDNRQQEGAEDLRTNRLISEWFDFLKEFQDEPDRAVVILGAAKIDLQLYQILRKTLASEPSGQDPLFDGDGPLSTLSAKIRLAHRLALIDDDFANVLHLVRKVRNAFAHEVSGCDLNLGSHKDRVRALFEPLEELKVLNDFREVLFEGDASPSTDFRLALSVIVGRLEAVYSGVRALKLDRREPLVNESMLIQKSARKGDAPTL